MTTTPHPTAQPKEKPAYVPPRVLRLGDLNEGVGACTAGSGVVAPVDCSSGNDATGMCLRDGGTATGGAGCNAGGGAMALCNNGTGVT